jgi:hypothetical protein
MIGCMLRNTPDDQVNSHGANGQDTGSHTHHYALRVLTGIQLPDTGAQLQESRAFTTPLRSAYATVPIEADISVPTLPATFSLASVAPSSAIITAAKPGSLPRRSSSVSASPPTARWSGDDRKKSARLVLSQSDGGVDLTRTMVETRTADWEDAEDRPKHRVLHALWVILPANRPHA